MEINNYNDFKRAIKGATKASKYVGGSRECDIALGRLLVTDKEAYEEYNKQLNKEFAEQKKRTTTEG